MKWGHVKFRILLELLIAVLAAETLAYFILPALPHDFALIITALHISLLVIVAGAVMITRSAHSGATVTVNPPSARPATPWQLAVMMTGVVLFGLISTSWVANRSDADSTSNTLLALNSMTPRSLAITGVVTTSLLAAMSWSLGRRQARVLARSQRATMEVRASEARLRAIVDAEPECVKIIDSNGLIVEMNPAGLAMLEAASPDQVRGRNVLEFITSEHQSRVQKDLTRALAGERVVSTFEITSLKGTRRWMEQTAIALPDDACPRGVHAVLAIARDITLRREAEEKLSDSEQKFRSLVESMDVIVWEFNIAANVFTYVSPQAAQFGYPLASWREPGFWQTLLHPDDRDEAVSYCRTQLKMGGNFRLQYRMLASDGRIVWIGAFISVEEPREHSSDAGSTLRGVFLDITAQKCSEIRTRAMLDLTSRLSKADQVVEAAEAVLDALDSSARCLGSLQHHALAGRAAVLAYGFDGVCRFVASRGLSAEYRSAVEGHCPWKEGAADAFPFVVNDVMAEGTYAAFHAHFAREQIAAIAFIPLQTERGVVGKIMLYSQTAGGISPEHVEEAQSIAASAGMSVGRIIATRRLERGEREAQGLRLAAEAASKAKSEFLANMSHEIRTPLTAILGFADLLREDGDIAIAPAQRLQTIDTIKNAGVHLLTVINDILDLSKIEANRMTVERITTPLIGVIREIESLMRPRAIAKGIALHTRLACPVPEYVVSDPTRLRQILMNLVGNAVKFTDSGSVILTLSICNQDAHRRIVIDVEDTGVGMNIEQSQNLFAAFGQADSTITRKHGGTGLGLTISRRLATLMGGSVTIIRTHPGEGSCFRVDLPLEPVAGAIDITTIDGVHESVADLTPSVPTTLAGRILLAEDGIDNQRLIAFHLRKAGATVDIADNGIAALEMYDHAASIGAPYNLLISDIQMPEMDGYTLARTLRQRGSAIPIVALTAHAMAEDRVKCADAGCNGFQTKPIDKVNLLATCAAWMGQDMSVTSRRAA